MDASFEWGVTRNTPRQFESFLKYLKDESYKTVSLQSLIQSSSSFPAKPVVLTFDDTYESVYTQAFPLLKAYGFFATVFILTGYIGKINFWDVNLGGCTFKHLSWDGILDLHKAGFEIGSHTVHHYDLTRIPLKSIRNELERSKKTLEDKIGVEIPFIAFPFGRFNRRTIDIALEVGYRKGCGAIVGNSHRLFKESFVLERKTCYLFDRQWNLKAKLEKTPLSSIENFKLRIINFCSHGTSLVKPGYFR